MKVRELYCELEKIIPKSLSCDWDNDGLMCCPDGGAEVKRVLVALDVTGEVIEYAKKNRYDVIVSHHPLIFKGIKALDGEGCISPKLLKLLRENISVMSFHTRLDAVEGGVNDTLADILSLSCVEPIYEDGVPLGRVGVLKEPLEAEDFARVVKETLGAPFVLLSDSGRKAKRVAVVGGSGSDFIEAARGVGADTLVSGRLGYHEMTDAPDYSSSPINLIEAGHFYTEHPVCETLRRFILKIDSTLECEIFSSNIIKAI